MGYERERTRGRRRRRSAAAVLARRTTCALAIGALAWAPAAPAQGDAATDNGDDLKDKLVDDVAPYHLMPEGDPLTGRSGPIDWDEMGSVAGVDTSALPEDLRTYVNSFVGPQAVAIVMGMQADELDPDLLIHATELGLSSAEPEAVTLPRAEAAHLPYTAYEVAPPNMPAGMEITVEMAMLADDDIAVLIIVEPLDLAIDEPGESGDLQAALDEFVNAQAAFVPGSTSSDDRIGNGGIHRSTVDGSSGGNGNEWPLRRIGTITSVALLTLGGLLLMRYLHVRRHPQAAPVTPGGWPQAFGPTTPPTAYGPPLPGLGGPTARAQYPTSPPYADTPPVAPVAPVPPGGFRAGRGGQPLPPAGAPSAPRSPAAPAPWATPAASWPGVPPADERSPQPEPAPTQDGWTQPG